MTTVDIVLGVVLIVASIFLIVAVLMQHGKAHNLSGTIAGGAETFFGKTKGKSIDKKLSILTTVIAIIFVALVLVVYLKQDTADTSGRGNGDAVIEIEGTNTDNAEAEGTETEGAEAEATGTETEAAGTETEAAGTETEAAGTETEAETTGAETTAAV